MIIHAAKQQPFCLRVEYSHQTGVFKNTKQTSKFINDFKSTFRIRRAMSMNKIVKPENNFNKYYINPQQRYVKKSKDPKKEIPNIQDQEFIYQNLHNHKFNGWKHPLQAQTQANHTKKLQLSEQNLKKILKFKKHIESVKGGRIPILVRELMKEEWI